MLNIICENKKGECKIYGEKTEFKNFIRFYRMTCSAQCRSLYFQKICLEKYGCISPLGSKILFEKRKQTSLKKYGVEYPTQSNTVKEKYKKTCLERYGVENTFQFEEKKEKSKQTKLEKYDDEKYKNPEKSKITNLERYGVE